MSKYTKKQIEMFKRIDPAWKEIDNGFCRFHCIQIHKTILLMYVVVSVKDVEKALEYKWIMVGLRGIL